MALQQFDCGTTVYTADGSPDPLDWSDIIHTTIPSPMGLVIEGRCLHIVALMTASHRLRPGLRKLPPLAIHRLKRQIRFYIRDHIVRYRS